MVPSIVLAATILAASRPPAPRDGAASPPIVRATLSLPVTWRSATTSPQIGPAIAYETETPSLGVDGTLAIAPLGWVRGWAWLAPLELELAGSHRTSAAAVEGGPDLSAREQRASVAFLYPFAIGPRFSIGPRIGWALHRFTVDGNPVPPSVRHGPELGVDVSERLPWADLLADAFARLLPASGPGRAEREALGPAGDGWGFQVGVAVRGPLAGPFGWRVGYDFLRFADAYSGVGSRSAGGSGEARYHAVAVGMTFDRGWD